MSKQPEMVIARNPRATRNNDTTLNLDNQMYQQPVTSFQRVSNDAPLSEETKTAIQKHGAAIPMSTASRRRKPRALPPAMSVFPKKISWTARATVSAIRSGWKNLGGDPAKPPTPQKEEKKGYWGTNFNRPGFQRMLADIKAGKINALSLRIAVR